MDKRAWQATVHGVAKSWTELSANTNTPPSLGLKLQDWGELWTSFSLWTWEVLLALWFISCVIFIKSLSFSVYQKAKNNLFIVFLWEIKQRNVVLKSQLVIKVLVVKIWHHLIVVIVISLGFSGKVTVKDERALCKALLEGGHVFPINGNLWIWRLDPGEPCQQDGKERWRSWWERSNHLWRDEEVLVFFIKSWGPMCQALNSFSNKQNSPWSHGAYIPMGGFRQIKMGIVV